MRRKTLLCTPFRDNKNVLVSRITFKNQLKDCDAGTFPRPETRIASSMSKPNLSSHYPNPLPPTATMTVLGPCHFHTLMAWWGTAVIDRAAMVLDSFHLKQGTAFKQLLTSSSHSGGVSFMNNNLTEKRHTLTLFFIFTPLHLHTRVLGNIV